MRPRVLILTSEPTDTPGGMEHVLRELETGLDRLGYCVVVLNRENSAPGWVARPRNKWMGYVADVALSLFLGRQVRRLAGRDLGAVVSNGPFGWYLPRLPKSVRKIHFYHGTYRGQATAIRPFIAFLGAFKLKWWDSMVLERLSGRGKLVVCNSDQTRREVEEYFGYLGKTVWLPLDTSHFVPLDKLESRRKLELPETGRIGLFVGSTHPTKGFPTVRRLVESFPEVHWCLALRGSIPEDLAGNGKLAIFRNATRQMLPSLYSAADFVVCPSLYESFGYVIAEGLACGVPVVGSFCGASNAFLPHTPLEHLVVADAHSCAAFETAVQAVLASPERYRDMVLSLIRPEIEKKMGLENWLRHFRELTNI
jgi:glycosyltransferase involved in cell wall biosynthesis